MKSGDNVYAIDSARLMLITATYVGTGVGGELHLQRHGGFFARSHGSYQTTAAAAWRVFLEDTIIRTEGVLCKIERLQRELRQCNDAYKVAIEERQEVIDES